MTAIIAQHRALKISNGCLKISLLLEGRTLAIVGGPECILGMHHTIPRLSVAPCGILEVSQEIGQAGMCLGYPKMNIQVIAELERNRC